MSTQPRTQVVLANGASGPTDADAPLRLDYRPGHDPSVHVGLPLFIQNVCHLAPRVLDLLEIAAYVFAADRRISRGPKDAVEYDAWGRRIQFHVKVRDYEFWSDARVTKSLASVLEFMAGDADYEFHFEPGHSTPPVGLFDRPGFTIDPDKAGVAVTLFSGGLDSLCGALDLLQTRDAKIVLVSHESQAGTIQTQHALVRALQSRYPGRIFPYPFECTLRHKRAREETQRTRSFLYTSIAYAIASAYRQTSFFVYENGVTSINLRRREDLGNARASRTTHPKAMGQMRALLSLVADRPVRIELPFVYHTKADIIAKLSNLAPELLSSTVSCSQTFKVLGEASHCGYCFQCIDRRIAAHSAGAEEFDNRGLYSRDMIAESVDDQEALTTIVDYVRQALSLADRPLANFEDEYLSDYSEFLEYLPGQSDGEKVDALWKLFHRHGCQVKAAISKMRSLYEDLSQPLPANSLLHVVAEREYLKPEQRRLAGKIASLISPALGNMFAKNKPKDEPDLNEKLGVLLRTHDDRLRSEHPTVSFACARVIPDHQWPENNVLVECKYIRNKTVPSKVTEGIAADLTKYPSKAFIVFVVYDPDHQIPSDVVFQTDIESKGRNQVLIVR